MLTQGSAPDRKWGGGVIWAVGIHLQSKDHHSLFHTFFLYNYFLLVVFGYVICVLFVFGFVIFLDWSFVVGVEFMVGESESLSGG